MIKHIKTIGIFLFLIISLSSFAFSQETYTITTYYPSPYGVYKTLRLYPNNDAAAGDTCTKAGEMTYHQATNTVLFCNGTQWQALGGTYSGGSALPICDSTSRGKEFLLQGNTGMEDGLYICKKKADDSYDWIPLGSPKLVKATPDWFSGPSSRSSCYVYFNMSTPDIWITGITDIHNCPYSANPLFTLPANAQYLTCYFDINLGCIPYRECSEGNIDIRIVCNGNPIWETNVYGNCVHCQEYCHHVTTPIIPISGGVVQNCHLEAFAPQTGNVCDSALGVCYYVAPQ